MSSEEPTSLTASESPHSVSLTTDRAVAALDRRSITVFARVDHAAGARSVGLPLPDEELLIFGDPKAGTLLMQSDPTIGYELPLRLLAWDAGGQTMIGYRTPLALAADYAVADRSEVLDRMNGSYTSLWPRAQRPSERRRAAQPGPPFQSRWFSGRRRDPLKTRAAPFRRESR
jgi:uncharacterized protein (DUF302 family)